MNVKIKAVYRTGTFVPQAPCEFPEGSEVDLLVRGDGSRQKGSAHEGADRTDAAQPDLDFADVDILD